jgi:two-component system, NarL family, sensor histidine kinase UhpB
MSLRFRLIGLVCLVLLISLALGVGIAFSNASRSVRTEMRAALLVGRQTIENAVERLQAAPDPVRELGELIGSFRGNRHLRVRDSRQEAGAAAPAVEKSVLGGVPAWFARVIGVGPETAQIPVAISGHDYGTIVIETDPHNETLEVWNEFTDTLVTLAVFCGLTILLIYVFIGRTLRPLERMAVALEEIGGGRYRTRINGPLPLELSRLRDSFNRMAAQLATSDAENRRLNERLLSLQEQERAELARDLHDRVSPYLFAIGADAATALRLIEENRLTEASDHIHSITDAVRYIQRQIREMLGRLRPIGLAEFGLTDAIENLVAFWRRRRPEIQYEVAVSAACKDLGDVVGTTICRIVQEALSNAVRHAEAKLVTISVERSRDPRAESDEISVIVSDDGRGMREPGRMGYGLIGISERVGVLGGRLSFANQSGRGFRVAARLPVPTSVQPVEP